MKKEEFDRITQEEFDRRSAEVRATPEYQKAYREEAEAYARAVAERRERTELDDKPIVISGWMCPVCQRTVAVPDEEFHVITSEGVNYWCCNAACRDVAVKRDTDLPHHP